MKNLVVLILFICAGGVLIMAFVQYNFGTSGTTLAAGLIACAAWGWFADRIIVAAYEAHKHLWD